MDYLPLLPPGAGCQAAPAAALGASSQAQGRRPPRTSPGGAEDPRGTRNLVRPGGDGEQEVSILQRLKQSQVPTHPASEPSGGASPRSAGRGSATPHPGPAPEVHAGGARARAAPPGHYLARPSPSRPGPDGDSTPRAVPLGSECPGGGDVARGSPVCSEQLPGRGSQPSRAERAPSVRPSSGLAHWGFGPRDAPSPDGHYLGRNS